MQINSGMTDQEILSALNLGVQLLYSELEVVTERFRELVTLTEVQAGFIKGIADRVDETHRLTEMAKRDLGERKAAARHKRQGEG